MFFPYEDYIHSSSEAEWKEDSRKRNNCVKYLNIIVEAPEDCIALFKFCNTALFFRNVFTKEAFLYFFLNKFEEGERKMLARIVFEMFVTSKQGVIGEHRKHLNLAIDLYKDVSYCPIIEKNYKKVCERLNNL